MLKVEYKFFKKEINISKKEAKKIVLNTLLRNFSIVINKEHEIINHLQEEKYLRLTNKINLPNFTIERVRRIVDKFLVNLKYFKTSEDNYTFNGTSDLRKIYRKMRVRLFRIYRFIPIFDYERARENLRRLNIFLKKINFNPHFSSRLALVLLVTDKNEELIGNGKKILEKNIRVITKCSKCAFYRLKNTLNMQCSINI